MGGTWIANLKWSGVSLKILLEDAKVNPGANAVLLTGYDNWVPPISLDIAMHPDTLLAMKVNDQALSDELGGPVKLIPDARPGAFWVNGLKTVEVAKLPTDHPVLQKMDKMADQRHAIWLNSGFLKPAQDGTEIRAGEPLRLEGCAFAFEHPLGKVLFSGDYFKTWQAYDIPQPTDGCRWYIGSLTGHRLRPERIC